MLIFGILKALNYSRIDLESDNNENRIIKPSEVVFANDKIQAAFRELEDNDDLKKSIKRAIVDIQVNAYYRDSNS